MKKLSKKAAALLMSLCLGATLWPAAGVAAATPDDLSSVASQTEIQPRYSYIRSTSVSFFPSGSFGVDLSASDDVESIQFTVELQKKGLFGYSTVETLSKSCRGSYGSYNDSFDLGSGTYRIKVTYEVFTANDSESVVKYKEA